MITLRQNTEVRGQDKVKSVSKLSEKIIRAQVEYCVLKCETNWGGTTEPDQ